MDIESGIIGLPQSGRTTVFSALTKGEFDTGKHTQKGLTSHIGIVKALDPRLEVLNRIFQPKRTVPASVTYIDISASIKGLAKDEVIGGQLLGQLSNTDVLINVVRAFSDESIPHIDGNPDTERDIATIKLELAFSDLAIIERRLGRIEVSMKGAKQLDYQRLIHEKEILAKIKTNLENDIPIRELELTNDEARIIANFQLLTAKPMLIVVNIGEDQLPEVASLEKQLNSLYAGPKCNIITLCSKLEMELAQLDNSTAETLRAEFGLIGFGINRIVKTSYELLGLISFFTVVSSEIKAWLIRSGTDALKAAGKIHSDIERGFIRAEVISYQDLVECGSLPEARKKGLLRIEGKAYGVQDGDVITFLFNV